MMAFIGGGGVPGEWWTAWAQAPAFSATGPRPSYSVFQAQPVVELLWFAVMLEDFYLPPLCDVGVIQNAG